MKQQETREISLEEQRQTNGGYRPAPSTSPEPGSRPIETTLTDSMTAATSDDVSDDDRGRIVCYGPA